MQYILTQEELTKLINDNKHKIELEKEKLQELCSHIADTYILPKGHWKEGHTWGCILTREDNYDWYCDDCPMKDICPYEWKNWSQ